MKWGRLTWDHRFLQMMLTLYIPSLWFYLLLEWVKRFRGMSNTFSIIILIRSTFGVKFFNVVAINVVSSLISSWSIVANVKGMLKKLYGFTLKIKRSNSIIFWATLLFVNHIFKYRDELFWIRTLAVNSLSFAPIQLVYTKLFLRYKAVLWEFLWHEHWQWSKRCRLL